jgi:hypothetical protein
MDYILRDYLILKKDSSIVPFLHLIRFLVGVVGSALDAFDDDDKP